MASSSGAVSANRSTILVVALASAPRASNNLTASARFNAAANISGVSPFAPSLALISAPFSTSEVIVLVSPDAAAIISGVVPLLVTALASAPAASSAATTPEWPPLAARYKGV